MSEGSRRLTLFLHHINLLKVSESGNLIESNLNTYNYCVSPYVYKQKCTQSLLTKSSSRENIFYITWPHWQFPNRKIEFKSIGTHKTTFKIDLNTSRCVKDYAVSVKFFLQPKKFMTILESQIGPKNGPHKCWVKDQDG